MDFSESFFDTGEVRLRVLEGPRSGPPIVLLHGATGSSVEWMNILPRLAERWHVFALDLRGHGLSGRPAGLEGYHISHHVADTVSFLREVVPGPAVLMGHSYGAVTAILAGEPARDTLRALVLEDPPLLLRRSTTVDKPFNDYFGWVYQMRLQAHTPEEILARLAAQNPAAPPEALKPWAQNLAWLDPNFALAITTGDRRETMKGIDFAARVRAIACPALLMQADPAEGGVLPQEDVDFFLENAQHARLARFPGVGHGIHTGQPEAFLKAFNDFNRDVP